MPRCAQPFHSIPSRPSRRRLATTLLAGIVSIAALVPKTGSAQGFVLGTRIDTATGDYPRSLALGDLNGDGLLDVAVVDFQAPALTVLLGDGRGGFSARTDYPVPYLPLSVVIEDVSGDGHPDVLVASYGDTVSVFLGDGLGGLGPRTGFPTARGPFCVAVGDLNEDGKPDLVTANYLAESVSVMLGDGTGKFGPRTDIPTGSGPRSVTIGDLNGDGRLDLVVTNYTATPASIGVMLGDGKGGFGPHTDFLCARSPFYAAIGDLSGDGKPDVAVAGAGQATITVLHADGTGGFTSGTDYFAGPGGPVSMAIGDVNGDARPDLVAAVNVSATEGVVLVYQGDGAGGFAPKLSFPTGASSRWAQIGDMNGDGRPDLVVSNGFSDNVSVLLGNRGGEFGAGTDFAVGGAPASVAIGDVSGDGRPDLVTANSALNAVSVQLGDGSGGFGAQTDFATGNGPAGVAIADLSGDGKPDLAVANESAGGVSVLLGNGAGGFGEKSDFVTGGGSRAVAVGDLSGDGKPDLAVANSSANTVSVLLGNGAGGFGGATSFATGTTPTSVAIADVSNDGAPDLAVANAGDGTVSILLGDGHGGFGAKTDFVTGSGSRSVAIGDLNGDGKPDLAVANAVTDTVAVLFGDGVGGFGSRTGFATGHGPVAVAIADVNGDGRPDLILADSASSTVSVLLGNGAGDFGPRTSHPTGSGPVSVAVGDVSGDGRMDLAVANRDAGSASILLGFVPTRTALSVFPDSVVVGSSVTLTATVSVPAPGYGTPADSVRFFDGPMLIGAAQVSGGVASGLFSATYRGVRSLTAVYQGDARLFGSISAKRVMHVVASGEPVITRIVDVAGDQGGHVSVHFAACLFDYVGSATPITRYDVYRSGPDSSTVVATMPATSAREYEVVAPTLADRRWRSATATSLMADPIRTDSEPPGVETRPAARSPRNAGSHPATFVVRALTGTAGVFFDSSPDSGYSVDNVPPGQPAAFAGQLEGGAVHLHWSANTEPDLCCYRLHRGPAADFEPGPSNLIASLSDTSYVDSDAGSNERYYKLTAVDVNGNVSASVSTSVGALTAPNLGGQAMRVEGAAAWTLALERVQPNPSRNAGMLVRFTLPRAAPARLEVLDVSGRRVLERAVGAMGPGPHTLGLDARHLPAGTYVLRLSQGGSARTTRVAVLK